MPDPTETEIWFASPGPLAAALPYQAVAGGRSAFRRADGRVTRNYHQHTLILTRAGEGVIEMGRQVFSAPAGSLVWLDTSRPYAHGAAGGDVWRYLWLGVQGAGLDLLHDRLRLQDDPVLQPDTTTGAEPSMAAALNALATPGPGAEATINAAIAAILSLAVQARTREMAAADHDRLATLRRALRQDPARGWTVAEMAALAHLGPAQLFRRFRAETGSTPMGWLRQERMERARHLLSASADSITQIAQRCGYADPFHFSRDFKRHSGQSPRSFRAAQGRDEGKGVRG